MECVDCGAPLMVARSDFKSEEGSTEVFQELTLVCVNPKCDNYCGEDLSEPRVIAAVIKNKVN